MEFKDYVRIVLSHWVGVVLLAVVGVLAAAGYNATQPKVYQASATGLVSVGNSKNASTSSINDSLARNLVTSYVSIAKSSNVADRVSRFPDFAGSGLPDSSGALAGDISVDQPVDTVLLTINARASSPERAVLLADLWVKALADEVGDIAGTPEPSTLSSEEVKQIKGPHIVTLSQATGGSLVLPRTNLNLLIGLLLGLILGFGYAMIRHQFDRRLRSSEEVEKRFGHPVIGMIASSSQMRAEDGRALTLAVAGPAGASSASTAEGFRKLRTNLAYMDVDDPPRVIVVTSPKQSDGKSTVAANLAAAIAIGGQPVTLIDGDLRRPTVADSLAMVDGAGLTDVLVGRVKAAEVIQDHPDIPGLQVMASGAIPPNPSELLGSKTMQSLIRELSKDAMVIIDAPPLLPVTDAAVLTRSADGAIVVVSYGGTLDTELSAALGNISAVHGRTLGIVFNRMRRTATSGFYGGDYYRYEYKPDAGRRKNKARRPKEQPATKA
ncbi:MAG TPA: polysaccharide biosynthesis tyrosine autokinase [Nocardioides sp.]|uniref:polysaccharide biosynthesis tyrosine autokinase n=1 Tax=Nocardioides sp. TaxID=35761 RepID=UPI002F4289C2